MNSLSQYPQLPCPYCNAPFPDVALEICPSCKKNIPSAILSLFRIRKFGNSVIIKHLASGGMGEIFLAMQEPTHSYVALKILRPNLVTNSEYVERFLREVQLLGQIDHINVVSCIESGYENGIVYFSMPFISGGDLKTQLDNHKEFTELEVLLILRQIIIALQYCWDKHHLIHRDIKPSNIMIDESGQCKIMDFGVSKQTFADSDLTITGTMVGSPHYISPEQAKSEAHIDFHSDMYSLGVTAFHLATGSLPYIASNSVGVITQHMMNPIPNPKIKNHKLSTEFCNVIVKMMQKKTEKRYKTWQDNLVAIENILNHSFPANKKTPSFSQGVHFFTHSWHRCLTLSLILILTLIAFGFVVRQSVVEKRQKDQNRLIERLLEMGENQDPMIAESVIQKLKTLLTKSDYKENKKAIVRIQTGIEQIENQIKVYKEHLLKEQRAEALKYLIQRLNQLDLNKDFKNAIDFISRYQIQGEYKTDPEFQTLLQSKLIYFSERQNMTQNGL